MIRRRPLTARMKLTIAAARRRAADDSSGRPTERDGHKSWDQVVGLGFGIACEHERAVVRCRNMNIDHLHGGELLDRAARAEAGRKSMQAPSSTLRGFLARIER